MLVTQDLLRAILLEAKAGDWADESCSINAAHRIAELASAALENRQPDLNALCLQSPELIGQELYDKLH